MSGIWKSGEHVRGIRTLPNPGKPSREQLANGAPLAKYAEVMDVLIMVIFFIDCMQLSHQLMKFLKELFVQLSYASVTTFYGWA